ncbi:MAG: hypothetical protein OEZ68_17635 [Gammaproteobacteria bacterium]|nr:hypothetical protein [Gammaproteobacteria bacterium]MDH5802627.1 hypothetical protein [Gammaproteobacteria bacterium]
MKVLFVVPKDDGEHSPLSQFAQCRVLPPIGLARMAGLAGRLGAVQVLDERLHDIKYPQKSDIVILFINHYNQYRAYQLAAQYRALGCVIVFTGPMLTHTTEQAKPHADSLFIGSGETNLPEFLWDYRFGRVKSQYHNETGVDNVSHGKTQRPALALLAG